MPVTDTSPAAAGRPGDASRVDVDAGRLELPPLPAMTVARMERALELVEQLADESTDTFLQNARQYRERHRESTRRAPTMQEAGQLAAALGPEMAAAFGSTMGEAVSSLTEQDGLAYDDPAGGELLLAAGLHTAPSFMRAARVLVALVEMPADQFAEADIAGAEVLRDACERNAQALRELPVPEARARASRALAAVREATGLSVGEAGGLLAKWVGQAMAQAIDTEAMGTFHSAFSSVIDSPLPSPDGDAESSFTSSPGPTQ